MDYQDTGIIAGTEPTPARVMPAKDNYSTPLLTSIQPAEEGECETSQPLSAYDKEPPTALSLVATTILLIILFLPFILIIGSFVALNLSKRDPLGFSFLAFLLLFSLVPCGLGITLLIAAMRPATRSLFSLMGIDGDKHRHLPHYLAVSWSLLVFYLIFYCTALVWASSRTVADLIDDHGVWKDFQAKVNVQDALDLLTRCLYDHTQGFATVEDFTFCAKDIGITSAAG